MKFLIGHRSLFLLEQLKSIHNLRYEVFFNRLQWSVSIIGQEEIDEYDEMDPVIIAALDNDKQIRACCRILPTTGPYMLRDTFPSLLGSTPAPDRDDTWEISRFAVDKAAGNGMTFTRLPARMIAHLVNYALLEKIEHYVFVTTVGVERLLMRMNVHCERVSLSKRIGKESCVALWLHIDSVTIAAVSIVAPELFGAIKEVA